MACIEPFLLAEDPGDIFIFIVLFLVLALAYVELVLKFLNLLNHGEVLLLLLNLFSEILCDLFLGLDGLPIDVCLME